MRVTLTYAFLALCAVAGLLPAITNDGAVDQAVGLTGWPSDWEGEPIREVPLSERELRFNGVSQDASRSSRTAGAI